MVFCDLGGPGTHFGSLVAHLVDPWIFVILGALRPHKNISFLVKNAASNQLFIVMCSCCFFECMLFLSFCDFECPAIPVGLQF